MGFYNEVPRFGPGIGLILQQGLCRAGPRKRLQASQLLP